MGYLLELRGLTKSYPRGIDALRGVHLAVDRGEFVVILGPSGAGKSTLMRCINRLVVPTTGEVVFRGESLGDGRRDLRAARRHIGMIFQQFNLVKRLSVLTNVLAGRTGYKSTLSVLCHHFTRGERALAMESLARVDLADKAHQRADTLSGGEQQRVAIARALVQEPQLILADEPVASLDPKIARNVLGYLKRINQEVGITVLCNLHQVEYAREFGDRVVGLSRGRIVMDGRVTDLTPAVLAEIYEGGAANDEGA
jgi:phosphonate transport system ATP-binding protein